MAGALGAAGDAGAAQGQRLQYVGQVVNEFMGTDCSSLPIVSRPFALSALVDLNQALLDFAAREQMSVRLQGYNAHYHMNDLRSVVSLGQDFRLPVAPVQYNQVERGPGELINCVTDGLFLLGGDEQAMVVQLRLGEYRQSLEVSAMARTADEAGRCLEWLARRIQEASIFRGRVVSLECSHVAYGPESSTVRIHRFPAVRRDEVILPESTMSLLERSTIRYFEHAAALRRSGRAVRHGVLLHGKPGTGKTYTAMWLAGRLEGVTVILLAAEQLGLIRQCCQMARMLQPSMVIMEDVDLVAISRDLEAPIQARVTLHQLLNEMDGLEPESEILFLLTTNRPDTIEPALASRPGRIDQAIEYPLPDDDCRRRLLDLYARGLTLETDDLATWVRRTKGASPAFIKELLRKSALVAAMRGGDGSDLHVTDADLDQAIGEMVLGGGALTRRLLAFDEDTAA